MEALLKNGTKIFPSTKKFDIPEGDDADTSAAVTMAKKYKKYNHSKKFRPV